MAYQIDRYNQTPLTVVEDGTIDQTTDIRFVGRNFAGYGEIHNENFLFLLENFAGSNPPPRAISGQVWFDSSARKLKFYDGTKWRTTGGAETTGTEPAGLTEGDFWWDTDNEQLFAYNGSNFILIGPQDAGENITQMQSRTVRDAQGNSHSIITSLIDGEVVYVVSNEEFTLSANDSIPGFDIIKPGLTLINTTANTGGETIRTNVGTNFVYWGTASNAEQLGGVSASEYIQQGNASFDSLVSFGDPGIAIGEDNDLKISIENNNQGVIENVIGNEIKFKAKDQAGFVDEVLRLGSDNLLPGLDTTSNTRSVDIGSSSEPFSTVYANNIIGTSQKATNVVYNSNNFPGHINAEPNTVALRDNSGDLRVNLLRGTALTAKYADLAEKYTTPNDIPVGSVVAICTHNEHECCEASINDYVVGVISENPAYLMNNDSPGQSVGLKGRLPVRVEGKCKKGSPLFVSKPGVVSQNGKGAMVGISLENSDNDSEKLIETFLKD
jgi:hypothetical protein